MTKESRECTMGIIKFSERSKGVIILMNWMQKLERKFGKYAIPNLMYYIIILYGIGFVLKMLIPGFYTSYLSLNAQAVLHGQVWRIFTFLLQPPDGSPIFIFFALYLYYMIGQQLEAAWGAFRFNLYFFMGVLFHLLAALLAYALTGVSFPIGTSYLNLSLFFAFAAMYPNMEFLLFFVLPVKVKYLAWVDGAFFGFTILQGILPSYASGPLGAMYRANALAAFVSLLNFAVFYLASRNASPYSPKEMRRKSAYKKQVQRAQKIHTYENGARHKCAVCGRTELDDPNLEFRYCTRCRGDYEYCQDHLFTHEHKK